jgi:uncharacterized protein YprB with RNaseH-like and TPR domain
MLKNTFIHLPHIGQVTEQRLWKNEINNWQDVLDEKNEYAKRFEHIKHLLKLSLVKLKTKDVRFFSDRLVTDQHWRIFTDFRAETAYLDIETTGLGSPTDYITTVSVYDGNKTNYYVHGKNLDKFVNDIKKYKVLVTYNGKCFDIPFIEREFGIHLNHAHLDLRYIMHSIGITGGLKSCEHQLGLGRGELEGVDGYFAVLLWKDYQAGNQKALETLLAYNMEDTINLEKLMLHAFEKKVKEIPLNEVEINKELGLFRSKKKISLPYKPDFSTINRIRKKYY